MKNIPSLKEELPIRIIRDIKNLIKQASTGYSVKLLNFAFKNLFGSNPLTPE